MKIEDLVNFVTMEQKKFNENHLNSNSAYLSSPLRQGMYLLAIACSQSEPESPKGIDKGKYSQLIEILNSIFNKYALAYFPSKAELDIGLDDKWHSDRRIAMPAFINYFSTGLKISTDHIKDWINYYFSGFEERIISKFGVSHAQLLEIGGFLESKISENFTGLAKVVQQIDNSRQQFAEKAKDNYDSALASIQNDDELKALMKSFYHDTNELHAIEIKDIENKFGKEVTDSVIEHFTTTRGNASEITYITDDNPIIGKPLLTVDNAKLYFVVNNSFYQAIIHNIEGELSKGKGANSYLKSRDSKLEKKSAEQLKRILPNSATILESAYETSDSHHEHDLVITFDNVLLIVEAKASPPREPMRDPSKAFTKIKDHFRSNAGIQKAYKRANSLKNNLIDKGTIDLFDKKGNKLKTLNYESFDQIYCLCITREDFGALATDLSLLLEKEPNSNYPWVANVVDLEFLIDGFLHLGLSADDFMKYLSQREKLHGKVFGTDELEYAGAFLKYGGLEEFIEAKADFIPLDISESDIFDEIYFAEKSGEKVTITPEKSTFNPINRDKFFKSKPTNASKRSNSKNKRKMAKKSKRKNRRK